MKSLPIFILAITLLVACKAAGLHENFEKHERDLTDFAHGFKQAFLGHTSHIKEDMRKIHLDLEDPPLDVFRDKTYNDPAVLASLKSSFEGLDGHFKNFCEFLDVLAQSQLHDTIAKLKFAEEHHHIEHVYGGSWIVSEKWWM